MSELEGRKCLVTGASGTIGLEICRDLARRGADVVALYRSQAFSLPALMESQDVPPHRIHPVQCDLRNPAELSSVLSSLLARDGGRLDVLVCCAGETQRKSALLSSQEDCHQLLELNFVSVVQLCRQALRPMIRRGGGRIILVGSRAGEHGLPGQSVYAATKGALHAFAKSLAFEVGAKGVTVNVVAPGAISASREQVYSAQDEQAVIKSIGLGRLGAPCEVAAVVGFLASPAAAYVSGAVIPVDGAARF